MIVVSVIGIILAFAVLIFAAYKKISMFLAAVLAAAIVALFGGLDVAASLVGADGPFLIGMKDFVGSWLVIFALGALLGALYDKSGATWRISSTLINKAGTQWTLLIYVLVGALLVYGGIQVTVMIFVLLPFAKILFPKAGIPWYLFPGITGLAIATFAMGQMPGSLQMQNIIPTQILGTALTAAPVEGVLATLFMIVVGVGYLYWQVRKGHNDPEAAIELYQVQGGILDEKELEQRAPGFWISLLPMVVTFVLINGFGVELLYGLTAGCVLSLLSSANPWAAQGLWRNCLRGLQQRDLPLHHHRCRGGRGQGGLRHRCVRPGAGEHHQPAAAGPGEGGGHHHHHRRNHRLRLRRPDYRAGALR